MIDDLQCQIGGCSIDNMSFKVLFDTDNSLLISTKVSGLQRLIDCADNYVTNHGLKFNPGKSKCMISGVYSSFVYW